MQHSGGGSDYRLDCLRPRDMEGVLDFALAPFVAGVVGAALAERQALGRPAAAAAVLTGLGIAALFTIVRSNWLAGPSQGEIRFEEEPSDKLLSLNLS